MYFYPHASSTATIRYLRQQRTKCSLNLSFYAKRTPQNIKMKKYIYFVQVFFFFNIVGNGFRRLKNIYFHIKHEIFERFQVCPSPHGSILKMNEFCQNDMKNELSAMEKTPVTSFRILTP